MTCTADRGEPGRFDLVDGDGETVIVRKSLLIASEHPFSHQGANVSPKFPWTQADESLKVVYPAIADRAERVSVLTERQEHQFACGRARVLPGPIDKSFASMRVRHTPAFGQGQSARHAAQTNTGAASSGVTRVAWCLGNTQCVATAGAWP